MAKQTPSNTIGPFFHHILTADEPGRKGIVDNKLAAKRTKGEHIRVEGRITGPDGKALRVPMLEIWQANAAGRYNDARDKRTDLKLDKGFTGYGRAAATPQGKYIFETVKPGPVPSNGNAPQAPHINLTLFAAGLHTHLYTRLYFSDEAEANDIDPVLNSVPEKRQGTLIAKRRNTKDGPVYRFNIALSGNDETVFFDV